ncbi:flavin reductase family protein [Diaphorobacter sp. HDW4A]|uniref:flavin reductase family protein n=1 Tax=Diaphorobacter sp. HDW4A TaxID=2714924 RepID=UPI00140DB5CB|nr:flavin reductase family protein [Diaphorobacter sp. HDW4A]QIL80030.1 flavin reductase family protein [Diaphorobacter sp. HDW4A]
MFFDIAELDLGRSYKLLSSCITPRPIAWVVTRSDDGRCNAAPFSLFNFFGGYPPVVCLGIGEREGESKDTLRNIEASGDFVINLVPADLAEAMNITATAFEPHVDELAMANLQTEECRHVAVPRIKGSPITLECRMRQVIDLDTSGVMLLANVLGVHVDDDAVVNRERCYIDAARLQLIGRMESPGWYTRTQDRFKLKIAAPHDFSNAERA